MEKNMLSELKTIFDSRVILYYLVLRNVKIKYKHAAIGVLWVILRPLLMAAMLVVVFSRYGFLRSDNYFHFAFPALCCWGYISETLMICSESYLNNESLVKKIYLPRFFIPLSYVLSVMCDLLIVMAVYVIYLVVTGKVGLNIVFLPAAFFSLLMSVLSFSLILSLLNVLYRDIRFLITFIIQIAFFLSPILYSFNKINSKLALFLSLNPFVVVFELFRVSLIKGYTLLTNSLCLSIISLIMISFFSIFLFISKEKTLAEDL